MRLITIPRPQKPAQAPRRDHLDDRFVSRCCIQHHACADQLKVVHNMLSRETGHRNIKQGEVTPSARTRPTELLLLPSLCQISRLAPGWNGLLHSHGLRRLCDHWRQKWKDLIHPNGILGLCESNSEVTLNSFPVVYPFARLIMNRHLYGPKHGPAINVLDRQMKKERMAEDFFIRFTRCAYR